MLRAAVMLVGVVFAACTRQKPPPAQGQSAVPYAHVSISRADSATSTSIRLQDRGGLIANGATVRDLIEFAHQRHRFDRAKIVGGATWIDSERYDVTVVGETEHVFGPDASTPGARAMLRNVLADRFDLLLDDLHTVDAVVPKSDRPSDPIGARCRPVPSSGNRAFQSVKIGMISCEATVLSAERS